MCSCNKQKINLLTSLYGEKRKAGVQEANRLNEDAKRTLFKLEEIMKSSPKDTQRKLETKYRSCSNELQRLQRDLQTVSLMSSTLPSRNDDVYSDGLQSDNDMRNKLLVSTNRVNAASDSLSNAHRIAAETEDIGTNVLVDLHSQRRQLENARDNLSHIDDNMTRGRKLLTSMARRVATNKLILAFIIFVEFVAICLIVYFKWIGPLIQKAQS